jgi:hypothetical protein
MEKQNITITINPDGTLKVDMDGFSGKSCIILADELEELLGDRIKRELKPEVYDEGKESQEVLTTST